MPKAKDQEFVEGALKILVNNPKDVKVKRTVNELGVLSTIDVNPEDAGLVIGKKGSAINALRHLARIIGKQNKSLVSLKLAEHLNQKPAA